ncbi:MAG: ABC transporter permease [Promethearchaeota archaeon]
MRKTLPDISLIKIRIFSPQRLRLFILGIIVISAICSSSAAFLLGISYDVRSFVGEEENTVIITASDVTTPITSHVSILSAAALRQCDGVKTVSLETLTLAIMGTGSDFPVTVRGITSDYLAINKLNFKEGINPWGSNSDNSEQSMRGVVIGATLAQTQNLHIGDKLTLTGTYATGTMEIDIVGILEKDSHKEEILVPLWIGQILCGLRVEEVTLIRVHFNSEQISKQEILNLMEGNFLVQINLIQGNSSISDNFNITVYDSFGKRIPSLTQNLQKDLVNYSLSLGIYTFSICRENIQNEANITLLVNKDITVDFDALIINSYTLSLLFLQRLNATVSIWSPQYSESLAISSINSTNFCKFVIDEQDLFISIISDSFTYLSPQIHFDESQIYLMDFNNTYFDSDDTISDLNNTDLNLNNTDLNLNDTLLKNLNNTLSPKLNTTQLQDSWMFRARCTSPSGIPVVGAQITLHDSQNQEIGSGISDMYGLTEVKVSNNSIYLTTMYEGLYGFWNGNPCINASLLLSKTPFVQIILDPHIDLEIKVQDEFYQPLEDVPVTIKGVFLGMTQSKATNLNGSALFRSLSWDKFVIEVDNSKIIRKSIILVTSTTIMILYPSVVAAAEVAADYSFWVGHRKYAVNDPKEYVSGFLETTFVFLNVIILALIALIITLVFLSFGPIISQPILQSTKDLEILQNLGASLRQRRVIVLVHLSIASIGASCLGALFGEGVIMLFGLDSNNIIGGVSITPIFQPEIFVIVVLIAFLVTVWNVLRVIKE